MSSWRAHFGYNKYLSITSRATQRALKDDFKSKIESRSSSNLRYQTWEAGKPGEQVWIKAQEDQDANKSSS
ncbi:hypothetical protein BY996DRAFT_6694143 [Phakopsora pachyrhizi]|uniref:Uncharacterized protein n=1 Tax=Phakopsora pachyrhizi TaxID=170000 RepID=A0AAV0AHK5_PHAPC|nr:hypothetical protein BY996DRAFT_6694143 [Phakopsora pachyrhizi]CAH7667875.1 hypothetical protein PPACK8108_LOCUS2314 [Phakopsora pachyrhizi]